MWILAKTLWWKICHFGQKYVIFTNNRYLKEFLFINCLSKLIYIQKFISLRQFSIHPDINLYLRSKTLLKEFCDSGSSITLLIKHLSICNTTSKHLCIFFIPWIQYLWMYVTYTLDSVILILVLLMSTKMPYSPMVP